MTKCVSFKSFNYFEHGFSWIYVKTNSDSFLRFAGTKLYNLHLKGANVSDVAHSSKFQVNVGKT